MVREKGEHQKVRYVDEFPYELLPLMQPPLEKQHRLATCYCQARSQEATACHVRQESGGVGWDEPQPRHCPLRGDGGRTHAAANVGESAITMGVGLTGERPARQAAQLIHSEPPPASRHCRRVHGRVTPGLALGGGLVGSDVGATAQRARQGGT